jgi:selenocysteine lyase/cysteine desulfurase
MITEVSFDGFNAAGPYGLEAGTPNVAGVIGLSAALEWLAERYRQAENWSRSLATLAEEELAKRPGFRSFRCQESSLLAFDFEGVHHSDMVTLLAESGIALRAGQHCAQPLLAALRRQRHAAGLFAPIIPKTMLRRWSTPWTAPWKFWWINDNSHTLWHNHYRRDAAPDLRPAHQWEDKYRQLILLGKKLPR